MTTLTRGERFKDARNVHNKNGKQTMNAVEQATGVYASLISALENDNSDRSVGYDKVAVLAKHYGVSADWLLCLTEDPAPKPCAADELGLRPTIIEGIMRIKEQSEHLRAYSKSVGINKNPPMDPLSGLNIFLESTLSTGLYNEIYMFSKEVEREDKATPCTIELEHKEIYSKFGKVSGDSLVIGELEDILVEKYPELEGRIKVSFASFNLQSYLDGIMELFERCLRSMTGYGKASK